MGQRGESPWQGSWVRGVLELAVVAVLTDGDNHGYALAQRLTDSGFGPIRGGVLYPVLARLEAQGAVTATWQAGEGGPGRKVYSLTAVGRRELVDQAQHWDLFAERMAQLLSGLSAGKEAS